MIKMKNYITGETFDVAELIDSLIGDFIVDRHNGPNQPMPIHQELELPGVSKDKLKVTINDERVQIVVSSTRRKGSRTIQLTKNHDIDKAKVKYIDGLLTIDIPLKEIKSNEREIKIE